MLFEEYNVQVIMPTHIPLEVSDKARENIMHLKQEGNPKGNIGKII